MAGACTAFVESQSRIGRDFLAPVILAQGLVGDWWDTMQTTSHTNRIARASAWLLLGLFIATSHADPQVNSWLTGPSGRYARIYETDADQAAGNAVNC
jgi:hypothetical protein